MNEYEFLSRLRKRIDEIYAETLGQLGTGFARDYADYMQRVGHLRALDRVREECKNIVREMNDIPARDEDI